MEPLIVLRAEAGPAIGGGHVMRCLAVAEALRRAGGRVAFAASPQAVAAVPRLAAAGIEIVPPEPRPCAAVLIDGYGFTTADETAWRRVGARVAVLDDAPVRPHDCDLLVDPGPERSEADYRPLVGSRARLLLGPAYAPVDPAFVAARPAALERRKRLGPPRSILVSPGLTDAGGASLKILAGLQTVTGIDRIVVTIGAAALSAMAVRAAAAADPRVRLAFDASDMAQLTLAADLAIGAAGVSTWERCALGLPGLVLISADNQLANARALAAAGAAVVAGPVAAVAPGFIRGMVEALIAQPGRLGQMAAAGFSLCDGEGASRIAEALLALASAPDQA